MKNNAQNNDNGWLVILGVLAPVAYIFGKKMGKFEMKRNIKALNK